MALNQGQQTTLSSALKFMVHPTERYMVIKGRAGTGKSYLTEELYAAIKKQAKVIAMLLQNHTSAEVPIYLTATTNKAAKVLADFSGIETMTIHSLLGLRVKPDFATGTTKLIRGAGSDVIENSVILIDEAFFFDDILLEYLDQGTKNCKIFFIGDPYQCAPVFQTHSPIEDLVCRTEELTEPMRNKGALSDLSDHWRGIVKSGIFVPMATNDPNIIFTDGTGFANAIQQHYSNPFADENENRIICWTNKQSSAYSNHVRNLRGLPDEFTEGEYLQVMSGLPKLGFQTDQIVRIKQFTGNGKMMGIDGKYAELYSRDILFIPTSNHQVQAELNKLKKEKRWKEFYAIQENIPDLRAIHGCTIHKAQGSTYKNVFIDLNDIGSCNIASDVARMMHVAVSRASEKIIFRGALPSKYGG